jgi:hypothetical protein
MAATQSGRSNSPYDSQHDDESLLENDLIDADDGAPPPAISHAFISFAQRVWIALIVC